MIDGVGFTNESNTRSSSLAIRAKRRGVECNKLY